VHYKNGREAKNGDKVVSVDAYGNVAVGILYDAKPGNDYCNGRLALIAPADPSPCLRDCLHLDDVKLAIDNSLSVKLEGKAVSKPAGSGG
jgi:hypothetical protein